jgi:hypothetical protein
MNRRLRRGLLALMWGAAILITVLSLWLVPVRTAGQAPMFLVLFLMFGVVGTLIADRKPRNPVGWTFVGAYVFSILYALFNL